MLNMYSSYDAFVEGNKISIFGVLNNALFLFPAYYICIFKDKLFKKYKGLFVLAILYLLIYSLNLDIQNRFTSYIGIFFVIMISIVAGGQKSTDEYGSVQFYPLMSKQEKIIMFVPLLFKVFFDYYKFYLLMSSSYYVGMDGNPLLYQTIFDAPQLPWVLKKGEHPIVVLNKKVSVQKWRLAANRKNIDQKTLEFNDDANDNDN